MHLTQEEYQNEGKRVLYEYFVDTLLCENPDLVRKCAKIEVKPLTPLNIITKASPILKNILI